MTSAKNVDATLMTALLNDFGHAKGGFFVPSMDFLLLRVLIDIIMLGVIR